MPCHNALGTAGDGGPPPRRPAKLPVKRLAGQMQKCSSVGLAEDGLALARRWSLPAPTQLPLQSPEMGRDLHHLQARRGRGVLARRTPP